MKIPNLPVNLSFLKKKEKHEYFLSLVLRDEKTSAVVFKEVEGRVDVVGEHHETFKTTLEKADEEELFTVIDQAVSNAEKSLPEGEESQKTIFGLKQEWIEDGKIKPVYLKKLKKISDELQFKPVGFLVITEALIHLLGKQEGAPVSAVIVEIGKDKLTLSLSKSGRVLETKQAEIAGPIVLQVDKMLKHFTTAEVLPSRIILFDNGSEKLQQEFIAHKWSHDLGFLHVPQITNLPANFDARAVLSGAATQMGFEILEGSLRRAEAEEIGEIEEIVDEAEEDKTLGEAASEFGFSSEDVKKKPKTAVDADDDLTAVDSDNITLGDQIKEIPEEEKIRASDSKSFPLVASGMFLAMKKGLSKIKLKDLLGNGKSRKKILLIFIPIVLLIIFLVFYFFMRTATVSLGLLSEEISESANVTFSESAQTSASDDVIKVEFITASQDGKVTVKATGTKETGERAKGTVTVFNNGDSGITLSAGTTITSSNDLNFTLDKAVTVASASGDIFSGTEPGKADVSVTATEIGTNYNLPSDTKFTVDGRSSVAAKNDTAFSGGTLEELTVVDEDDLEALEDSLEKKLEKDAKNELENKAGGDLVVLPNFTSVTYGKKSFSKDVGDEANEVALTGTIEFEGISYRKSELAKYAQEKLKNSIPDGMEIDENELSVEATKVTTNNGKTTASIEIKAALIPEIDTDQVAKDITGDSFTKATRKLQQIPGVEKVDIDMFLNLPLLPNRLPFTAGKIIVTTEKDG